MNIIWISSLAWKNKHGIYDSELDGPGAVAGSLFQQNIIEGLENQNNSVDIISEFPGKKNNKKNSKWTRNNRSLNLEIKTSKIVQLNYFAKIFNIIKGFKEISRGKNYDVGIIYLMHLPYILAAIFIKITYKKNLKLILICPDLPDFMDLNLENKKIKKTFKIIEKKIIKILFNFIEGYVLFSEPMIEKLNLTSEKSIVIEGVYSENVTVSEKILRKEAIMYSGSLQPNFGIENLIAGFENLNRNNTELWIFGAGILENYILKKASNNKKIKFFGFVDRETVLSYQRQASLLVNLRNPDDEFTKYSFPSKTFEYMASGTPLLCTKLPGIPQEYFEYMYAIDSNSVEKIYESFLKIFDYTISERDSLGEKAKKFIISHKNKNEQAKKINTFLKQNIIGGKQNV